MDFIYNKCDVWFKFWLGGFKNSQFLWIRLLWFNLSLVINEFLLQACYLKSFIFILMMIEWFLSDNISEIQ